MPDPNAVTPDRETRFQAGVNEKTFRAPKFHLHVPGENLARNLPGAAAPSQNMWKLPGNAWALRPHAADMSRLLHPSYSGSVLSTSHFNAAPAMSAVSTTPQTGGFGGGALGSVEHHQKDVADTSAESTANANNSLIADTAAYPKPPTTRRTEITGDPSGIYDNQVPMDRVLSGVVAHAPNQAFALSVTAPSGHWNADAFFTFYFGGPASTLPLGTRGGEFALTLAGSGEAELWERDLTVPAGWMLRKSFRWAEPGRAIENSHTLQIIPYGRDRIAFRNRTSLVVLPSLSPATFQPLPGFRAPLDSRDDLYAEDGFASGHQHLDSMTGAGPVRVDIRRDYQDLFLAARLDYPAHGFFVTDTFTINHVPEDGELVYVTGRYYKPPGTAINFTAYSEDGVACSGPFLLNGFRAQAGKTRYYLVFDFTTTDPSQTPVLYDLDYDMDSVETEHLIDAQEGGLVQSVWINQGVPDQEIALLHVEDTDTQLSYLRDRGGVRCRVLAMDTSADPPTLKSVLFEGRATDVRAHMVKGAGGFVWPGTGWRSFPNLRLTGLFSDLAQSPIAHPRDYSKDRATDGKLPWKVTDVIRDLFHGALITDAELDIPDINFRLFADALNALSLQAQFASDPTVLLNYLIRDVLNTDWVRDYNAGSLLTDGTPRGLWRVLPPVDYTNVIATLYTQTPASVAGKDPVCLASYPHQSCWLEEYDEYPVQAENNEIEISGTTGEWYGPSNISRKLVARLRNIAGQSDPTHPDFIPRIKRYVPPVDVTLTTFEAVWRRARIEYRRRCHGLRHFEGVAPLLLVVDPRDSLQLKPRPLRKNDAVIVSDGTTGRLAVIENCVLRWDRNEGGDRFQYMDVEGRFQVNLADGEVF